MAGNRAAAIFGLMPLASRSQTWRSKAEVMFVTTGPRIENGQPTRPSGAGSLGLTLR